MNKLSLSAPADLDPSDQPQPEARMREALGLRSDGTRVTPVAHRPDRQPDFGSGPARRHRFVQEGEIPVEVATLRDHAPRGPTPRHRVDDAALAAEKLAREQAERAFSELSERLREVQTKLGHAELARDEAMAMATARLHEIEVLRAQASEPPPAPARRVAKPRVKAEPGVVRPRGRPKAPKPVKWWIKGTPGE